MLFLTASGASKKSEETKTSILLHVIGEDALEVYNTFQFAVDGDKMKLQ